jgi:inosine/xanthosine triphosphatase
MQKIIIASKNPVKINAALCGFKKMFPKGDFEIEGVSVASGVSDQPLTDAETFKGAFNRVENAFKAKTDADYWIGIEGGVEEKNSEMEAFAWIIVKSKDGKIGKGRTGTFFLPPKIVELIRQGEELGKADDIVFKRKNSKQENGAVGILTEDVISRTNYYIEAVVLALIPFKNPDLY